MNKQIGMVNYKVIELLDLNYKEELPIFLGDSNIEHMKKQHFEDYEKYGEDVAKRVEDIFSAAPQKTSDKKNIINNPTYVARNPNQDSIEYIKEYKIDNAFVLVAVRISSKGTMFAKTLFTMTERKKNIYLKNGYAKKYE